MRIKKKPKWLFSGQTKAGAIAPDQELNRKTSLSTKYSHLTDCPLQVFIENICGVPYLKEWPTIYKEYIDALEDRDYCYIIKLEIEIEQLNLKVNKIQAIIKVLKGYLELKSYGDDCKPDVDQMRAILRRELSFLGNFDLENREEYLSELEKATNLAKSFLGKIAVKEEEKLRVLPKGENDKIEPKQFDKIIVKLSKYMGYQIIKKRIMASEFVDIYVDMRESLKVRKNGSTKRGR